MGKSNEREHVVKAEIVAEPHCVPLILAYRHSIQKVLEQRQQIKQQSHARQEQLSHLGVSISQRRSDALNQIHTIDARRRGEAVEVLKSEWAGDSRWISTILYGGGPSHNPTEQTQSLSNRRADDLLADLDRRLQSQRDRLDGWRKFHQSLPVRDVKSTDGSGIPSGKPTEKPLTSFDKHQIITLQSYGLNPGNPGGPEFLSDLHGPFADLLDRLNHDLSTQVYLVAGSHCRA